MRTNSAPANWRLGSGASPPSSATASDAGGTRQRHVTLNNFGAFCLDGSASIIDHPEVGIRGVGRIIDKPWRVNGKLAVRKVADLTLTFDHRVCYGGTAADSCA